MIICKILSIVLLLCIIGQVCRQTKTYSEERGSKRQRQREREERETDRQKEKGKDGREAGEGRVE